MIFISALSDFFCEVLIGDLSDLLGEVRVVTGGILRGKIPW